LPLIALAALAGWTGLGVAQEKKAEPPKPKSIVDVAKDNADLKTFSSLLERAGLVETLKGKGPFTVLAPTDAAFKKLGPQLDELQKTENMEKLQKMLKNHVIEGRKTAAEITKMESAKNLLGSELMIEVMEDNVVMIQLAKVTKADIAASNGLIHVIDKVLMPAEAPAHP
jgi:uncharacterized surface protein with fasciclin (FAS1) repeats